MLTIDTNVFVSARVRTEANQAMSDQFLKQTALKAVRVYCPTLVLPETAAAVTRATNRAVLPSLARVQIETFPNLSLEELTLDRARRAADIAITCRLRGAGAAYAAVAQEAGTTLITWDAERLASGEPDLGSLGTRAHGLQSYLGL